MSSPARGLRVNFRAGLRRGTLPVDDDSGRAEQRRDLVTVDGEPLDWRVSLAVRSSQP